jgi:hypothetical protein
MKFKKYLKDLAEETTAADIAPVDTKLDMTRRNKHLEKGKKCKQHKKLNCEICAEQIDEGYWN